MLHSKGNNNQNKWQPTVWEKIFANDFTNKGLVTKIYKLLMMLNNTTTNDPINKGTKDIIRHFSKVDIQIAKKHVKRYSTSLILSKIWIKTAMRYHFTLVKMAIIKKIYKQMLESVWREWNPPTLLVGM